MTAHACPPIALLSPSRSTLTVCHGRKHTCLAITSGRGITSLDLSEIGRDQLLTALLDWKYVAD
ncbi:MAG: hypothetical protein NTV51_00100, partial [Verrucomicrobia bacterium]|nr:hypothetical protein [Verrucomicrobiota bacterium]